MLHEACFWKKSEKKKVQCSLCAHHCMISDGKTGICGVRKNENGQLVSLIYAACSSVAVDPVEKKPFFHFCPGSEVLSFGSVGCNFRCEHCQNFSISTVSPEQGRLRDILPEEAVSLAQHYKCRGLAWTYNEPTIWHEYTFETAKLAKQKGFYTAYVTNGYITEEPLKELSSCLDAMNIDVKAFTEHFYKNVCKAKLAPVLHTCELAKELGIHVELTYLIIPRFNDDPDEIKKFCGWVVEKLGVETPVHFSRFHPDYKMTEVKSTSLETLLSSYETAKQAGLLYVYLGNIPHGEYENTYCPSCGLLCVERHGFATQVTGLKNDRCAQCGRRIPIILEKDIK